MKGILSSKFTLGGTADVAAGPVGREQHGADRRHHERQNPLLLAVARSLRGHRPDGWDAAPGSSIRTPRCTASQSPTPTSSAATRSPRLVPKVCWRCLGSTAHRQVRPAGRCQRLGSRQMTCSFRRWAKKSGHRPSPVPATPPSAWHLTAPSDRYTTLLTSQQRWGTKYTVSPLYS